MTRDAAEHKSRIPVWPFAPSSHLHRFLCVRTVAAQTVGPWLSWKNNTIIYTCYSYGLLYPWCTYVICVLTSVRLCTSIQAFQSQPLHSLWYMEYLQWIQYKWIALLFSIVTQYVRRKETYLLLFNSVLQQKKCYYLHFAYRQSIIDWTTSNLALMEKLIKLVSTRIWYGGPSWVLYWKNRHDGYFVLDQKKTT